MPRSMQEKIERCLPFQDNLALTAEQVATSLRISPDEARQQLHILKTNDKARVIEHHGKYLWYGIKQS